MFYETQRIINKQRKYMKSMAYSIIVEMRQKQLNYDQSIDHVNMLLSKEPTEFQVDVLNYAKAVLKSKKESKAIIS
jgi:hypothetical protein